MTIHWEHCDSCGCNYRGDHDCKPIPQKPAFTGNRSPEGLCIQEIQRIFEEQVGDWNPDPKWISATLRGLRDIIAANAQTLPGKLEQARQAGAEQERERLIESLEIRTKSRDCHKVFFNGNEIGEYSLYENAWSRFSMLQKAILGDR